MGDLVGSRGGLIAEEKREISYPAWELTSIPVIKPMTNYHINCTASPDPKVKGFK
jgi:hypothetical protein